MTPPPSAGWLSRCWKVKGAPRNEQQGMAWLQRAVKGGDPQAQYLFSQRQTSEEARERYLVTLC